MLDHKYKVFYHLAKNPNTTKVAEELLLSQPAVSKSIKELEKELGITLFHRTKGRLQLTESGKYLLTEIEFCVQKERKIEFEIHKQKENFTGPLYLGGSTTLSQYILPEVLAKFKIRYPQIAVSLLSGNTDQIERQILDTNLHLAFIEGTPTQPDIHYIPFLRDEIVLVSAANLSAPDSVTPDFFSKLPLVLREKGSGTYHIIRKHLLEANIDPYELNIQLVLGSTEGIKNYLLHSNCYALLSIYSIRNELATGKLKITEIEGLSIDRMLYMIHRQGEPDPYARQFMDFAIRQQL